MAAEGPAEDGVGCDSTPPHTPADVAPISAMARTTTSALRTGWLRLGARGSKLSSGVCQSPSDPTHQPGGKGLSGTPSAPSEWSPFDVTDDDSTGIGQDRAHYGDRPGRSTQRGWPRGRTGWHKPYRWIVRSVSIAPRFAGSTCLSWSLAVVTGRSSNARARDGVKRRSDIAVVRGMVRDSSHQTYGCSHPLRHSTGVCATEIAGQLRPGAPTAVHARTELLLLCYPIPWHNPC